MSGIIGSKLNIRGSGRIAKLGTDGQVLTSSGAGVAAAFEDAAGGGLDWQSVTTGSTLTAVAGNGYPIDTTSNACTITLPASASVGDQIVFTDYARNWATNKIIIDSNGLNYQGEDDTYTVEYTTDGQSVNIVYMDATNGWIPISDDDVADAPVPPQQGIFGFGNDGSAAGMTNLVSTVGVVASDVTAVGTARVGPAACEYGGDKGIFGYGGSPYTAVTNLVTNAGVVGTDVTGVGQARNLLAACTYSANRDKGIFGFGSGSRFSMTNLVSNTGVVGTDVTGVGTARDHGAACEYGDDKAIFTFGEGPGAFVTNLVSTTGVVASDVTGVGTERDRVMACDYGTDTGIIGFGYVPSPTSAATNVTNLVSNTGVVASDQAATTGTSRYAGAACEYGVGKGIFGFGYDGSSKLGVTNLVSDSGVVATDVAAVGTARDYNAACSFAG